LDATRELVALRKKFSQTMDYTDVVELKLVEGGDKRENPNAISKDGRYEVSLGTVSHTIKGEHLAKLLRLYRLHTDRLSDLNDPVFVSLQSHYGSEIPLVYVVCSVAEYFACLLGTIRYLAHQVRCRQVLVRRLNFILVLCRWLSDGLPNTGFQWLRDRYILYLM
jgi:hypothetical protein